MIRNNNIFIKALLILTCLLGWSGSVWAQGSPVNNISATFNNASGNSNWGAVTVTPNATDASGNAVAGVSISVNGTAALKAPVRDITSAFLGPDDQTSDATAHTYTFTVENLPEGSKFERIALPLKGVNSQGANQNTGIKEVNVDIVVTDGTNQLLTTTLTNKSLTTNTQGEIHQNISYVASSPFTTNTGRLVVSFRISKGGNNVGCYMAFHGLELGLDVNTLHFSSEPSATGWDANTNWYSIRNNRSNQAAQYNRTFLSTVAAAVNDNCELLPNQTAMPDDRGSYWCFVGDNEHGFVIQNAAYGPHFVLGISGNNSLATVKMLPKDNIPSGYITLFTAVDNSVTDGASHAYAFRLGTAGNTHIHITQGKFIIYTHTNISGNDTGSAFKLTSVATNVVNSLTDYDVYKVNVNGTLVSYTGTRNVHGKRITSPYIILEKGGEEISLPTLSAAGFNLSNFSVAQPDASTYMKTISVNVDIPLSQPKWYYIQNYNGNAYLSTGSGYLLDDGGLALSNTAKPADYQGLWMEIPTGEFDANGNGITYFVNAYSGDTRVLALTGADGNAKAKMYTLDELPANAKVFFERRYYTGHDGSFYYREPNTNNYWNKRTDGGAHLAYWNSDRAYGESGSRFAHSEVYNLPNNVTIHFEGESGDIHIPADLKVIYESLDRYRMVDGTAQQIAGATHELTDGMVFNFDNVPFLLRLFTTNNREYLVKGVRVEDGKVYIIIGQLPRILHRQSHLFDKLEATADNELPGQGYIKKGEGMTTNPFTGEAIQYNSNYTIVQYVKHGVGKQLYMPTIDGNNSEVTAYQRWYDYKTESRPRTDVINIPGYVAAAGEYLNGYVVGSNNSRGSIIKNATANLPTGLDDYWLAVDQSRYNDGRNEANGDLLEPSLTMRVIYHLVDAKVIADSINKCTNGSAKWYEQHTISFPNRKLWNGSDGSKSGVDYVGLTHEFSNYWTYDGTGTADGNLEQLVNGKLHIELDPSSTAAITNVKILETGDAGIRNVQGFARNRFIAFQYPNTNGRYEVPENSHATINVYMTNAAGTRFQLARINLTFIGNAEPLLLDEVYGRNEDGTYKSARSKEAMQQTFGNPVSELTFDHEHWKSFVCPNGTNNEAYAFPLDYKQSSYGYHGSPWASRGEYIFRNGGNIGGKAFYPIESLKNAIDDNGSPAKIDGKYFLYVDASEQPGQVMSIPIPERLCVGSRMFCYGWFNSATQISQESVGIIINIVGKRNTSDETGEIIYSYCPGLLSTTAFNSENQPVHNIKNAAPWRQVGFSFTINSSMAGRYAAYEMQVMNNCYSTNGGDYTLDNFYIYVNPPKGNVDFTTPLCSDALRHVKVHTDYDMLIETSGVNLNVEQTIPVSFCFLNKEIYDTKTDEYYEVDSLGRRTLKPEYDYTDPAIKALFNEAFGDALVGIRSINKEDKGHAFHNFNVPTNYETIPSYHYNESPDDQIFKEEKGTGERRIVFKEQLYQAAGGTHQWIPGQKYYLLFAPYHVTQQHLTNHNIGTETFHIADECCILTEFSIMPPIEVKGDATITSADHVKACDNQVVTFKVDMPAKKLVNEEGTDVTDAVISGLNYDWWVGTSKADATHAGYLAAKYGTYATVENARRYNHQDPDDYPDEKDVKMDVYLASSLENVRFFFPEARSLDEVTLVPYDNGYGVVQEHLDCIRHFMQVYENGRQPLSLFGQTFNLKVSHAEADANNKQHFVAIPIIPEQKYSVEQKLIYCPSPQELIIEVGPTAPNMQNGFGGMVYPERIVNVPIRMGLQQANNIKKAEAAEAAVYTLNVPLRKIIVTGANSTKLVAKDHDTERFGSIFLTATDDAHYTFDTDGGEFRMRRVAQVIDIHATKGGAADEAYMEIAFVNDFKLHEGCTYTLKLPYVEDEECECEGTLVFDVKVVPEYQEWTAGADNTDWTNDRNWGRADRNILNADNSATGSGMLNATSLTSASSYPDNAENRTASGFVPMYFTNVLVNGTVTKMPELYSVVPATATTFLGGLNSTATTDIQYDMEVTPVDAANRDGRIYNCNYKCEAFGTNIANGLTFTPDAYMLHAEHLDYKKAWVEYSLVTDRWYTLSSPLQNTFAGEWYSPTGTSKYDAAKQLTPHFYDINYDADLNDRFAPAYYQRSWDSESVNNVYLKDGGQFNAYIVGDWSNVYNDVKKEYSLGGFSVKVLTDYLVDKPNDGKVLVRMPKADTKYTYYDINGNTGQHPDDAIAVNANRSRLWSDKLKTADSFTQTITNVTSANNYFLVSNPFMSWMDMDAFFAANPQFEKAYWLTTAANQAVSVKSDDAEQWISTEEGGDFASAKASIAPLQSFFVKTKTVTNTATVTYNAGMQTSAPNYTRSLVRSNNIVDEEEDEKLEDTMIQEETEYEGDMYDLRGVRVTAPQRNTIIIQNRKKKLQF